MKSCTKKILAAFYLTTASTLTFAADDGPRMYWNGPVGLNILQTYAWIATGNSILESGTVVDPDIDADMDLLLLGYNRIFDVAGHASIFTAMLTAGKLSADAYGRNLRSTRGSGDLYLQGTFNLIGAPALSAEEFANYKQDTLLSILMGVSVPTGEYNADQLLNLGANRWAFRVGLPFVQSFGSWVPGEITTLEILPSAWFYGTNDDFPGKVELEQDPVYTLEAHLTRDLNTQFYVSLDYFLQSGGETSIDGANQNDAQNASFLGATLGYQINEQFQFLLRYSSALNPDPGKDLDIDLLQLNLNYMW
jgi:hypothetical protein